MASTSTSTSRRPGNAPPPPAEASRPQPHLDPFVPNTDHNPRELKSWAKRTGFNSTFSSGESFAAPPPASRSPAPPLDLEKGLAGGRRRRRRLDIGSILGRRERERESDDVSGEIGDDRDNELGFGGGGGGGDVEERRRRRRREKNGDVVMRNWKEDEDEEERRVEEELVVMARKGKSDKNVATNGRSSNNKNSNGNINDPVNGNINGNGVAAKGAAAMSVGLDREKKEEEEEEVKTKQEEAEREQVQVELFGDEFVRQELMEGGGDGESGGGNLQRPLGLKCGIDENPGWGKCVKSVCISTCLVDSVAKLVSK